ncbi:hypothetical protein ACFSHT_14990 [Paraburkholderia silviterrae]|uniref:Lipoprotein n=1 Tax=Paraburkholderia silviterrae TaxID=2528715 RepID=A0A4R5MAI0_9BURK|nr:hypothetical protein [Paraburkholderia silviterrae]TDG23381.1 hypothetical protein EYW47_15820 [Paraburkholderia silviterrae]
MKTTSLMMLGAALLLGAQVSSACAVEKNASQNASGTSVSSEQKNYSGVAIQATAARGAAGSPISVEVRYKGLPVSGAAEVTYTTEGALQLFGSAQKALTPDRKGASQDTVVVQAASDGAYFLNVFVSTVSGTSVVSIPVTVGTAAFKPRAAAASTVSAPGGQRVIEMPAQETRH